MIEYIASLFTPTVLFCILNLMIGTIFISSSFKPQKKQHQLGRDDSLELTRVPSLLERVRSINYSFYPIADPFSTSQNAPPLLARAPSLFQRVCSLSFSPYRSEQQAEAFPLATHCADPPEVEPQPSGGFPSATHYADQPDGEPRNEAQGINEKQQLKKSAVEAQGKEDVDRRQPGTAREKKGIWSETGTSEGDETVDKKADDFINRFKQQLKLQRLESLLRETLHRRGGN